jgi:hypothetical protein
MKKATLLCGLLLALTATVASAAQGVNLRWSACFGDGGTFNRAFACNSNNGSNVLVGSFELGVDLLDVSGNEIVIDLAADAPVLPEWWHYRAAGTCRQNSLSFNTTIAATATNCFDWGNGLSVGGVGAYNMGGAGGPNTARIVAASAVPSSSLSALIGGLEYFSFNAVINNQKTVGTPSCLGCQVPVCIVFNSLNLTTPIAANNRKLTGPTNGTDSDFALWQGGGNPGGPRGTGCPGATPARSTTWGTVKSLYR